MKPTRAYPVLMRISYDEASGKWRIYDDGSSLGTSIFRDGHRIGFRLKFVN